MDIRKATRTDCPAIAELALMAGEGIPAYFWEQSRKAGQSLLEVGALNAASDTENFSWCNTHLALIDNVIAGMLLAYRLAVADPGEDLEEYPAFIRPLIELEWCVPESFYINMLATYPAYRNRSVGTLLMEQVDSLARAAGCALSSLEVFAENTGALRLYHRLGYEVIEQHPVVPHACHPYTGEILLLVRAVS
ncbi:MAG: N-acetyltransferase [Gammaproteobacteria bacterium]|nr:N-acetyltransferase [Gammaproteobacteria bacterium]